MKSERWLTPCRSVCGLVLLASTVVAGLGWVSVTSLKVEADQRAAARRAEVINKERRALWRLDSSMLTPLVLENNRPYAHYFAIYSPTALVLNDKGDTNGESVRVPSPLLSADLPVWMALHVQIDPDRGWESPQVILPALAERFEMDPLDFSSMNCTTERQQQLNKLKMKFPPTEVLKTLIEQDRMDPDLNPYVVPVPLLDEPGLDKPRGAVSFAEPLGEMKDSAVPPPPVELKGIEALAWTLENAPATYRCASNDRNEASKKIERTFSGAVPQTTIPGKVTAVEGTAIPPPSLTPGIANAQGPLSPGPPIQQSNGVQYSQSQPPSVRNVGRAGTPDDTMRDFEARKDVASKALGTRGHYEVQGKNTLNSSQNFYSGNGTVSNTMVPYTNSYTLTAPEGGGGAKAFFSYFDVNDLSASNSSDWYLFPAPIDGNSAFGPANNFLNFSCVPGVLSTGPTHGRQSPPASQQELIYLGNITSGAYGNTLPLADLKPPALPLQATVVSERKPGPAVMPVSVHLGPMRPRWLKSDDGEDILCLLRFAQLESKTVYQGVVLDWPRLQDALKSQVADLYPAASLEAVRQPEELAAERSMTALPVLFVPGEGPAAVVDEWSPLRWGLVIAWAAALTSIVAVAFGGRAILAMSERRVRFASAVTHELRTPLTALQLHLDLLNSGLITDEAKKSEYLATIGAEADRLNRLVENVLAFARLEKNSAQANARTVNGSEILDTVLLTWEDRLHREGFELVTENLAPPNAAVRIDPRVLEQVLGNLIDNARKYSKEAPELRIWVRILPGEGSKLALEVEDRGPGIPAGECRKIFRAFQRGSSAQDSGGAGLGLALAKQWVELFGGTISCGVPATGTGCRFRIELPMA